MAPVLYSSIFGYLTRHTQARFDAVSELHKRLFDNVFYEKYLTWDVPTIGLDFEEIIGKYNITVAAPTIGDESKEPILGTYGLETVKERVLNHALTLPLTMQEYRKVLQILDSKSISDEQAKKQLVELMFGGVTRVVKGIQAKLDMIFMTALSNEGKFVFDEKNNPEGGVRGSIDYNMPEENIAKCKTKWTDANSDKVDCMEDIQAILEAAHDKVTLTKVLTDYSRIAYICRSKKMKQMIWGKDKSTQILQMRDINEYMALNDFPTFEVVRRKVEIQHGPRLIPHKPWNENNMIFIPGDNLGVIKNAWSNNELRQEPGVAYSNYGRIRVSQWGMGETQGSNGVEFVKAESLSLPVITEINGIYTLKTDYKDSEG